MFLGVTFSDANGGMGLRMGPAAVDSTLVEGGKDVAGGADCVDVCLGVDVAGLAVVGARFVTGVCGEAIAFGAEGRDCGLGSALGLAWAGEGSFVVELGSGGFIVLFVKDGAGGWVGEDGVSDVAGGDAYDGVFADACRGFGACAVREDAPKGVLVH